SNTFWYSSIAASLPDQQRRKERFYRRGIIHRPGSRQKCRGFEQIAAVCAGPRMEDVMLVLVFRPFRGNQQIAALGAVHSEDGMIIGSHYQHDNLPHFVST